MIALLVSLSIEASVSSNPGDAHDANYTTFHRIRNFRTLRQPGKED